MVSGALGMIWSNAMTSDQVTPHEERSRHGQVYVSVSECTCLKLVSQFSLLQSVGGEVSMHMMG